WPGASGSEPNDFAVLGSHLYFSAYQPGSSRELWRTDGVTTALWSDINPGAGYGSPGGMLTSGDRLFFSADDGVNGEEPWSTDGLTTSMVADISPGPDDSNPEDMAPFGNGRMIFNAEDPAHGEEPWVADGSSANLLRDIWPGEADSGSSEFFFRNGTAYFNARDQAHGRELWASNGTGARLVKDILPGTDGSSPRSFTPYRGDVYFSADDGIRGREIWKLVPADRKVTVKGPRKLRFRPSGRADLKLTCPASEATGPCSGKFRLATASKVPYQGKRRSVTLAGGRFRAAPGKSDTVIVRVSSSERRLLKRVAAARNLNVLARVRDGAGNSARVSIPVRAVMPG
ncbi:MAG: hypothetical protein U0R29_07155, partial [Solirubrobacterales bacterium]